jgi:RNA polymerase sigma factor (sigma-70 family)
MRTDADLLLALTRDKSPEAFRLIVERYLEVVYAAARRQAPLLADDVTQAVFLLLWQRSAKIRGGGALAGWLVNATRLAALEARRAEQRRRRRETVASRNHPLTTGAAVKSSDDLAPFLDHALGRLGEEERTAVVLRYLENKSLAKSPPPPASPKPPPPSASRAASIASAAPSANRDARSPSIPSP